MLQFIKYNLYREIGINFQIREQFFATEATYQDKMIAFEGQAEFGIFKMQILI